MRAMPIIVAAALVASCAGQPVVADISQDKVQVVANGADNNQIQATADQACGMYSRSAQVMSHRCGDVYCIQRMVLFACVPPAAGSSVPNRDPAGRQYNRGDRVTCSFPNSPNPNLAKVELTSAGCTQSGGVIVGPAS